MKKQRIDSPYWVEFDRVMYKTERNPDGSWSHTPISTDRLKAQVLTVSFETQNMRVRAYKADTMKYFGTFDMTIDGFFKDFEIFKKVTHPQRAVDTEGHSF